MPQFFPHPNSASDEGLLRIGGRLTPDWLLDAYSHSIFPWPMTDPTKRCRPFLAWFSPNPRCIFEFDRFHISSRLKRTCQSGRFRITSDADFTGVIRGCAERHGKQRAPDGEEQGTWITPAMIDAYTKLHQLGHAHSVEAWVGNELAGGVYGVAIKGLFAAESMFFRHRDASKAALVALIQHLKKRNYQLVDIQMKTNHTAQFGAVEIPRPEYLRRLRSALQCNVEFGEIIAE